TGISRGVSVRACRPGGIYPARVPAGGIGWILVLRARSVRVREGDREAARLVGGASQQGEGRPFVRGWPRTVNGGVSDASSDVGGSRRRGDRRRWLQRVGEAGIPTADRASPGRPG